MASNLIIALATAVILACAVVGLYLLTMSNRMYYTRTRDPHFWTRFWLHKSLLSRQEYLLNRWGFWIVILATVAGVLLLVALARAAV
jgi:membrane protein DedA with SNARE-associated domain